jgi:Leucine-rich repeat (LRR) protein/tetrahydromethanopterin S-methyltransferase subunit G
MEEKIENIKKRLDSIEAKLDFVVNFLKNPSFSNLVIKKKLEEKTEQKKYTTYEMYQRKKRWVKDSFLEPVKKSKRIQDTNGEKEIKSFRGAKILKSEAEILEKLEIFINKKLKYISDDTYNPQMGFRVVENRVIELGLNEVGLINLPEFIQGLEWLQILILSENNLSTLPDSIGNLKSLKELYLGHNVLLSLPKSIGDLKTLEYLNLDCNKLKTLPQTITNLLSLKNLRLNKNKLEALPETIGNLKNLQELYLNDNSLLALPESIHNLSNLEVLALRNNKLLSLPDSIGKLISLESLDLVDNKLTKLPISLKNLPHIQYLSIKQNPLDLSENSLSKEIVDYLLKIGVRN